MIDQDNHDWYQESQLELLMYCENLEDVEQLRIAQNNRVEAIKRETGSDEVPAQMAVVTELVERAEKTLVKSVEMTMKHHPLGEFVEQTPGLGYKTAGRLLASIGDPCWNDRDERPRRGPAELWKYVGLAPGQVKRKGHRAAWNHKAKMRVWLITEQFVKQSGNGNGPRSPYRDIYEETKEHYQDQGLTDGHRDSRARRKTSKAFLKDLFNARKDLAP